MVRRIFLIFLFMHDPSFLYLSVVKAFARVPGAARAVLYLSSRQATPGSSLPSMNSRLAPPPVLMWVILSA